MPAIMQRSERTAPRTERPRRQVAIAHVNVIERDRTHETHAQRLLRRLRETALRLTRRRKNGDVVRIVILRDPEVLGGTTVIGGTRIPIWVIDDLARREGIDRVLDGYPELKPEEVMGAILYARHSGRKHIARDRRAYYEALPEDMRD